MPTRRIRAMVVCTWVALLAAAVGGCAVWTDRDSESSGTNPLPQLRENRRSLILKVEFIPIEVDTSTPDEIQSLWQWVDESPIDNVKRRQLVSNGIRVGRLLREDRFRSRLESISVDKNVLDDFLTQADIASEVSHGSRRIPMRMGRRYELPVRQPIDGNHVSLVRLNDELTGRTLTDPQFLFAVTPTSGSMSQQVSLRLRPEIQHGSMRQRWVSSDTALRIDTRRETWSLKELDVNLAGVENDTFVIGSVAPAVGIGKQMLGGKSNDQTQQQVIMLIKLAQVPTPADRL